MLRLRKMHPHASEDAPSCSERGRLMLRSLRYKSNTCALLLCCFAAFLLYVTSQQRYNVALNLDV